MDSKRYENLSFDKCFTESLCNLVDLVKTIKQIKSEVKQDLS